MVVSEEDQYKKSLAPDIAQYTDVNFDTYIKEVHLIKTFLIKNSVPKNINPVKNLDDFVKDTLKDKNKQNDIWNAVESAKLSQRIEWRFTWKKFRSLWNKLCCCWDQHRIPYSTAEDFTCCWHKQTYHSKVNKCWGKTQRFSKKMTKIYLGKSSVKTSKQTLEMLSNT